MNAAKASNYPDPFLDILQISFPTDLYKIFQDQEIISLLETFEYPRLLPTEIKTVADRIARGLSYNDAVNDCNYQFPFRPQLLQNVLSKCFDEKDPKKVEFCKCFILYSYVSYVLHLEKNCSTSYLPILLQCLNSILKYTDLALKAFVRSLSFYVSRNDFFQIKLYIEPIAEFFQTADFVGNEYACDIFADLLRGLTANSTSELIEDAYEIYDIIQKCADERRDIYLMRSAIRTIDSIKHLILRFDARALTLLSHHGPLLSSEYISSLCKLIVPEIVKKISSEEPTLLISPPDVNIVKLDKPEKIMEPILEFKDEQTFPEGFSVVNNNLLPEKGEIMSLCHNPDFLAARIKIILTVVRLHEETAATFLDTFMDMISVSVKNRHFYDMIAHFLLAGVELMPHVKLPMMCRFLYSDLLFDPHLTCSTEDKESSTLNTLRACAFELILNEGAQALDSVLVEAMPHPQLFTEMIYRCLIYQSTIRDLILGSTKLLHTLTTSSLYYQRYALVQNTEDYEGEKVNVDTVRLAIFLFFSSLFSNRQIETLSFQNEYFVSAYLSFSFEEPVRQFIMGQLRAFLTKDNPQATAMLGLNINKIVELAIPLFPNERALNLVNDIMVTVVDALSHQYSLADIFKPVTTSVIEALALVNSNKECQDYVIHVLQFFSVISHDFVLSQKQVDAIEKAINTVFPNGPNEEVYKLLVEIMAAEHLLSITPTFIIHQPRVVTVFFKVFERTERKNENIGFILELCNFSSANSIACHSCGLDMLLVESLLENWRQKDCKNDSIDIILQLFAKISVTISSADVVAKYISLLSPIENRVLPNHFWKGISCLNTIVSQTLKSPETSIPIPVSATPMQKAAVDISQGFTFVCWLELDAVNTQYKPIIFTFSDGVDIFYQVTLAGNIIVIYQRTPKSESTARVDRELPVSQMTFVSFTYYINEGMASLFTTINCQDTLPLQFPVLDFQGKPAVFSYGGVTNDSNIPESPLLTGPIALFPILDSAALSLLFARGPRQLDRVPIHPHFSFVPRASADITKAQSYTFLNVLIRDVKLTILLPLFSTLDMALNQYQEDECVEGTADATIELISNALLMSNNIEIDFANLNGFNILSTLLLQTSFKHLDYAIYLRFFTLLQMLRTGELQQQLLRSILGNLELLIVTDPENQLRIMKHWARVLFLTNSPTDSFAAFLSNTVCYYWDEIHDRNYLKGTSDCARPRPENLNVLECRTYMTDILLTMSQKNFTIEDFHLLMSYCKRCPDKGTVLSLTNLLLLMTKTQPSPLRICVKEPDFLSLLHQLFKRKWPEMTQILIETVAMLHVNKIMPPTSLSFIEHIEIIIRELSPKVMTHEVFEYIYQKLLPSIPELLPLCFWFAYNISDEAVGELVRKTEPSEKFVVDIRWAQWPIIIASQSNNSMAAEIFDFLAKCGYKQWHNIYSMILVVCKSVQADFTTLLNNFLTHLSTCLLCNSIAASKEHLDTFFDLIRQFLFFRDLEEQQKELAAVFRFSPYHEAPRGTPDSPKPNTRSRSLLSPAIGKLVGNKREAKESIVFTRLLSKFNHVPQSYSFGLRLDDRSRWLDFALAQNTLHLIHMTGYLPAFDMDLVICTFLIHSHPKIVLPHLTNFKLAPKTIANFQNYIDLLCFKAQRLNLPCSFMAYRSKYYIVNASKALFATAKWHQQKFIDMPFTLLNSIHNFYAQHPKIFVNTKNDVNEIYDCYVRFLKPILSTNKMFELTNKRSYQQLYSAITVECSPWDAASTSETEVPSRYPVGCYSNCPFKTQTKLFSRKVDEELERLIRPDFEADCELLCTNEDENRCGEFLVFDDHFEIVFGDNHQKIVKYREIDYILPRKRYFNDNCIEVFMKRTYLRKSYFIMFYEHTSQDIIDALAEHDKRFRQIPFNLQELKEKWVNRNITNFEYLCHLNTLSGRTFKDVSQYPIFPWVVKDYTSDKIKLIDTSLYRDLSRPIGTLNDERIKKLRSIAEDHKTATAFGYLYNSSYSNVPMVLSYLSNLPPFTNKEGNEEEKIEKMTSVKDIFNSVTSTKEDFREVIPEFYFQPEIFNNVELPPWAHESALEFVYLNRKVMESETVSSTLNNWIDLIWGSKSRGREAMKTENTFKPKLYEEYESASAVEESTYRTLGMIPKQLFEEAHPKRSDVSSKVRKVECITIESTSNSVAYAHVQAFPQQSKIVIQSIDAAGILKTDTVAFNKDNSTIITNKSSSNKNIDGFTFVSDDTKFLRISNKYILAHDSQKCSLLDVDNLKCNIFSSNKVQCIASDYPYFLVASNEFVLNVYSVLDESKMNTPVFRIPFFRTSAKCAAISNEFHTIAIGAGTELFLLTTQRDSLTRRVSLDGLSPELVCITPSWGFIVVYCVDRITNNKLDGNLNDDSFDHYFLTFSNNGELIKKVKFEFPIVALTTWKSENNFDFIAFASSKDKIYACEAFYLNVSEPIFKCEARVRTLHYSEEMKMITVVTRDGLFSFQPYSADDGDISPIQQ
ncbi:hypothetical protein TRFO_03707 [Tritrichomonas foetus]|uniref:BEACH domain-containing protein n=1 Tax=Tritrichomonas foetus TaxID=1144522 RepID=A0A1J4KMD5_9EUKA|nr:hypothetical protein TRFO_03707 [Tritrichomonas foetus]|eukprot:OHT12088.1 hypothetical protein TRFO_03707 [Tritrichomonas foetus]